MRHARRDVWISPEPMYRWRKRKKIKKIENLEKRPLSTENFENWKQCFFFHKYFFRLFLIQVKRLVCFLRFLDVYIKIWKIWKNLENWPLTTENFGNCFVLLEYFFFHFFCSMFSVIGHLICSLSFSIFGEVWKNDPLSTENEIPFIFFSPWRS